LTSKCDSSAYKSSGSKSGNLEITGLPKYLTKSRGDIIWWNATSESGISYYVISAAGMQVKTTNNSFIIPFSISPGYYILKITAYDNSGKSVSATSIVKVR